MRALNKDPQRAAERWRLRGGLPSHWRRSCRPPPSHRADAAPPTPTAVMPTVDAADASDDRERRRIRNIFVGIGAAVVVVGFLLLHSCTRGRTAGAGAERLVVSGPMRPRAKSLQDRRLRRRPHHPYIFSHPGYRDRREADRLGSGGATVTLTVATAPVVTPPTHATRRRRRAEGQARPAAAGHGQNGTTRMVTEAHLLGGRYELGAVIGYGGMAEVRRGRESGSAATSPSRCCASDLARDPTFQSRFRREAQSAASLNHPAIVAVYDTGEDAHASETTALHRHGVRRGPDASPRRGDRGPDAAAAGDRGHRRRVPRTELSHRTGSSIATSSRPTS